MPCGRFLLRNRLSANLLLWQQRRPPKPSRVSRESQFRIIRCRTLTITSDVLEIYGQKPSKPQVSKYSKFGAAMSAEGENLIGMILRGLPPYAQRLITNEWLCANSDDVDHARMRSNLRYAFSEVAVREQEPVMTLYSTFWSRSCKNASKAHQKGEVDMTRWYNFTTFDVIGDLSFGQSFEALEKGGYHR